MFSNLLVFLLFFSQTLPEIIDPDKETDAPDKKTVEVKIIGGYRTNITNFPILVSIRYGKDNSHLCGGSVIRKRWVLSAGHCLCPAHFKKCVNTKWLQVVAGSSYSALEADDQTAVYVKVEKWFVPNFQRIGSNIYNDISLILLQSSLAFNARISPALLPSYELFESRSPWEVFKECVTVGWGSLIRAGKTSINLRVVRLPLISFEECKRLYKEYIHDTDICTLDDTGKDTCTGDSGGPLLCDGYVVGICSRSFSCSWRPNIWTRVDLYLDWINWTIEKVSNTTEIDTYSEYSPKSQWGIFDKANKTNGFFFLLLLTQALAAK